VESIIFFAFHRSGLMSCIFPVLYAAMSCFACSRPAEEVRSVLFRDESHVRLRPVWAMLGPKVVVLTTPSMHIEDVSTAVSPGIRNVHRVPYPPPIRAEVILRDGQVTGARKRRSHSKVRKNNCTIEPPLSVLEGANLRSSTIAVHETRADSGADLG